MNNEKEKSDFQIKSTDDHSSSSDITEGITKNTDNNLKHIADMIEQDPDFMREIGVTLSPALENLAKIAQELSATIKPLQETARYIASSFEQIIPKFNVPTITKERKQELIDSYKKWGEWGWTPFPDMPLDMFSKPPIDGNAINKMMMPSYSANGMDVVFNELRNQKIKRDDLEDAIWCYNNRKYKPCALVLFAIIDAKLIRKQKHDQQQRPSGRGAAKKLNERFESNYNKQQWIFATLYCVNLFTCLFVLFDRAHDFKNEPHIINRNFVAHGMTRRHVRKRDCIQLFLALHNLSTFLELYGKYL